VTAARGRAGTPQPGRTVLGSCPLDCPDACSWLVSVDASGTAVKLRGNPAHPFTRGELCRKVYPWLDHAADPARLTRPLRRTGAKGEGRFEPVSWDDALAEMAQRLHGVIDRYGGSAVWPFVGTGNLGWLQGSNGPSRIWNRMGASAHNLSICSVAGREGIGYTVGTGAWLDGEGFARAGLVLIWGSNTLVTNRHLWPFVGTARRRGAPLVVVDPVRTRTAGRADVHLAPRPGSDGALALGLCREIVARGGAHDGFLAERTLGWAEFRASLDEWTLARTAEESGVDAAAIAHVAELIVAHPPLALRIGHGVQRQAHGGQAMRVVSCIPAVTGAYGAGGGALYSSTGSPKGFDVVASRRPSLGQRPRTLVMTNLGRNLCELDDPPVMALVVSGANPVVSNPQTDLVRRGLTREDLFTVVVDVHATETVAYGDLVLPSTMQHEQFEINDSYHHRYVQWNEPAVEPAGECLPHTEIWRRLAAAMGYTDAELYASDLELAADVLGSPELAAGGVSVERLRRDGFAPLPDPTVDPAAPGGRRFLTPSGRFEFASQRAHAAGHGRLPNYRPGLEATGAARPGSGALALIAAADDRHVNSTFAGTAAELGRDLPPVVVHPDDAAALGLRSGTRVVVANGRGSFEAVLGVSDAVRRGVAHTTKGRWHHGLNHTVAERDADMGGGAVFHDNAVTVRPA